MVLLGGRSAIALHFNLEGLMAVPDMLRRGGIIDEVSRLSGLVPDCIYIYILIHIYIPGRKVRLQHPLGRTNPQMGLLPLPPKLH